MNIKAAEKEEGEGEEENEASGNGISLCFRFTAIKDGMARHDDECLEETSY